VRVVADESVDKQIVDRLRSDGHDVVFIAELDPGITIKRFSSRAGSRTRSC